MTKRIGPMMDAAARYVASNPGCAILPVAEHVGPHGSRGYGYRTVHRAIRAGLIRCLRGKGNAYALYPLEKPQKAAQHEHARMPDQNARLAHRPAQAAQRGPSRWRLEPMDQNTPNRRHVGARNPIRPPATRTDRGSLAYLLAVALALATFVVACDLVGAALR